MINRWDIYGSAALLVWFSLQLLGRMPKVKSVTDLVHAINSRGGNIVVLSASSVYFFSHSIRLFYFLLDMSKDGKIGQDNAFALMALQFVTSTAFGGSFGALLKTMTGDSSRGRISDVEPNPPGPLPKMGGGEEQRRFP